MIHTHLQKCYRIAAEKCNEAYDTRFSHGQEFSLGFFDAARLRFCLNTLYLKLLFTELEVLKLNAGKVPQWDIYIGQSQVTDFHLFFQVLYIY